MRLRWPKFKHQPHAQRNFSISRPLWSRQEAEQEQPGGNENDDRPCLAMQVRGDGGAGCG